MPTYITLLTYTPQGIEKIKESPARLEKAKAAVKAAGGEMKAFYLTMGAYDAVAISEAPSNEAYAKDHPGHCFGRRCSHRNAVCVSRGRVPEDCVWLIITVCRRTQTAPPLSSDLGPSCLATCGSQNQTRTLRLVSPLPPNGACPGPRTD